MRKRVAAALCCLLLVFQLAAPPAQAADYICFVAAGESILPMSDATMPFWKDGYLYIASSVFTGVGREALNIGRISNDNQVILYSSGRSLWFEKGKPYARDTDGQTYYPGSVERGGETFVPAAIVAQFFGLQYSVTNVRMVVDGQLIKGDLAWIRRPGSALSEQAFVNAAYFTIASRYVDYLQEQQQAQEPETEVPEEPAPSTGVEVDGKKIFLCLSAGDNTSALLDALDLYGAQAAFFCTPDFLSGQGNLLRRMAAGGHAIGILVDAADPEWSVEEQLSAGNEALALATCGKTRLAWVENGDEQALQTAQSAGYRCLTPDLDRSDYPLSSSASASVLLQRVSARRGNVTVWLGQSASAPGLRAFLSAARDADGRCLAWSETA